jgi:hypothetical protein
MFSQIKCLEFQSFLFKVREIQGLNNTPPSPLDRGEIMADSPLKRGDKGVCNSFLSCKVFDFANQNQT